MNSNLHDRRPLRLALITRQFPGVDGESETAVPIAVQARALAARGDRLSIFLLSPLNPGEDRSLPQADMIQRFPGIPSNVEVRPLPLSENWLPGDDSDRALSLAVFHFLKASRFDAVFFEFEGGWGYYTLLAREMGLLPGPTLFYLLPHAPLLWRSGVDRFFLQDTRQLDMAFRERYCAAQADGLLFTNQALLDWMRREEWTLPPEIRVIPLASPFESTNERTRLESRTASPIGEVAFFADMTLRNGILLFCDAIDRLVEAGNPPNQITLLGKFDRVLGEHTGGLLLRRARHWPSRLAIRPELSFIKRLDYLEETPCLSILPALGASAPVEITALMNRGLPFIATSVGGIPEMIREEGRESCLCEPEAESLANLITERMTAPLPAPRPVLESEAIQRLWLEVPLAPVSGGSIETTDSHLPSAPPLVSVVLVHHDRPELLPSAVDSVRRQTYGNLELILVDDGSRRPESHLLLDSLAAEFEERGWTLMREPNRHLGAARNTGVRKARGERILFLDDDNILFPEAIESLVAAMDYSGSDVCTCLSRLIENATSPASSRHGCLHYLPLGGCLDLALFENCLGDANALIRREVFDRIGYLIEDRGYACHDWEFFTRALFHSLKVRLVPEPLYGYSRDVGGMYRSSHWYDNRRPILELARKHRYSGMKDFIHPALASQVDDFELHLAHHNILMNSEDEPFRVLHGEPPQSNRALNQLADIAEATGRCDTANLLRSGIRLLPEEVLAGKLANPGSLNNAWEMKATAREAGLISCPSLQGHIERIETGSEGSIRIAGWVVDTRPGYPAPSVAIFHRGHLLGVATPKRIRPDLAIGFKAPHLNQVYAQFTFETSGARGRLSDCIGLALNERREFHLLSRD